MTSDEYKDYKFAHVEPYNVLQYILSVYFRLYPTPCGPINSVNPETPSTASQQQGSDRTHQINVKI
jgi:hypothetical protein